MNLPSWFWTILPFLCESRTPQEEADQERGRIEVGHLEVSEVMGDPQSSPCFFQYMVIYWWFGASPIPENPHMVLIWTYGTPKWDALSYKKATFEGYILFSVTLI